MVPYLEVALQALHKHPQDDFADRLNYYYTTLILLFLAITVSAKQYVGQPIQCWMPAEFRGGWEEYAENYCFIQNTYFVPFDQQMPREQTQRKDRKIGYYQWVPIMLAIQALMFYLPNTFWNFMNWYSGFRLKSILRMAQDASDIDAERREHKTAVISHYVKNSIASRSNGRRSKHKMYFPCLGAKAGRQLTNIYLLTKLLYVLNVVGQFFIMNHFLATDYTFWGIQILLDLSRGKEWSDSGHFPRVTLCDFEVRSIGSVHTHTVQCVLMINMFNEKIYLFLWYWMFLVAICTMLNFIYWSCVSFGSIFDERFVEYHLKVATEFDQILEKRQINEFVCQCLRKDGVLLMRFVESCASELLTSDLIAYMEFSNNEVPPTSGKIEKPEEKYRNAFTNQPWAHSEPTYRCCRKNAGNWHAHRTHSW
uniref:Innexin n=1 Tax=Trichuris muris TaxID=70415 RepID=A0A5S6QLR1_TRIMR